MTPDNSLHEFWHNIAAWFSKSVLVLLVLGSSILSVMFQYHTAEIKPTIGKSILSIFLSFGLGMVGVGVWSLSFGDQHEAAVGVFFGMFGKTIVDWFFSRHEDIFIAIAARFKIKIKKKNEES